MFPMTRTVLQNLLTGSATRLYPLEKRPSFDRVRGDLNNSIDECIFCGICQRTCPTSCIAVEKKARVWNYDPSVCVYCGLCVEKCPTGCLSMEEQYRSPFARRESVQLVGPPEKDTGSNRK